MDKIPNPAQTQLLAAAIEAAQGVGLAVAIVPQGLAPHPQLCIKNGEQETRYTVVLRPALAPATLGAALHQLQQLPAPSLLVAPYVTPALADELKARQIPFLDAAGNAYINQAPLLVWIKGQKPAARAVPLSTGRAFQPIGLQLLFALLCDRLAVNRPYRELASMAGVAHGSVGWVMPDLQQLGHLRDLAGKRGTRKLFGLARLLNQWVDAYARVLRPRTLIGRYYLPTLEGWQDWPLAQHGALWGGEPAAALLTDYLRPGVLTLYADKLPGLLAAQQKFMTQAAPGCTQVVEVRRKFWSFAGDAQHPSVVPPLLVYADLLATGDARCIETAQMIYEVYVAGLIKKD